MVRLDNRYGEYNRVHFQAKGINIGDTLEISYSYTVPFRQNYWHFLSNRIFFNSSIFKEYYTMQISYPKKVNVEIFPRNGAIQDSIQEIGSNKIYHWTKSNLKGNLLEIDSRPYTELPYFILSIKPLDYTYNMPDSYIQKYMPTYVIYADRREYEQMSIIRSMGQEVKMKQFNLIRKFYDLHTEKEEVENYKNLNLKSLKNYIADSLKFLNDIKYFENIDNYSPNIGSHLMKGELRDISRYEAYVAFIVKMRLSYLCGYAGDKRSGLVDDVFFRPMATSDYFLLPIGPDGRMSYILPKSDDFGYYLNEYPFYYENSLARLTHLSDYRNEDRLIKTELRQQIMPGSNFLDNTRTTSVMAKVNCSEKSIDFTARVSLSGQYSTMTRGLYMKNYKDETVDPLYHKKLWELSEPAVLKKNTITILEKDYPFKTTLDANYISTSSINIQADTVEILIKDLINHITKAKACQGERTLNYYPDILGTDNYVYMFQFDKAVKIVETNLNLNVKNSFGEYILQIDQLTEYSIKLSSHFSVYKELVAVNEFQEVCEIYNAIEEKAPKSIRLIRQ